MINYLLSSIGLAQNNGPVLYNAIIEGNEISVMALLHSAPHLSTVKSNADSYSDLLIIPELKNSIFSALLSKYSGYYYGSFSDRQISTALNHYISFRADDKLNILLDYCADADKRKVLVKTVQNGDLDLLNFLLKHEKISELAHFRNNGLLKRARSLALSNPETYVPLIERLLSVPGVLEVEQERIRIENDMRARASDSENSMGSKSNGQKRLLHALLSRYENKLKDGIDVILIEIKAYLECEYEKAPALDSNKNPLPLEYRGNYTTEELVAYYKNPIHTAYRYLMKPNPWIGTDSVYDTRVEGGRAANILNSHKQIMACIWLAITDQGVNLDDGFTISGNQNIFAENLAHFGRAHNWDYKRRIILSDGTAAEEFYDDLEGDKPTCGAGVEIRLIEAPYGHPYLSDPMCRELTPLVMRDFSIAHLVQSNGCDNLIDKLDKLPLVILNDIRQELSDILNLYEDYKERDLTALELQQKAISLSAEAKNLRAFIKKCELHFGAERIHSSCSIQHSMFDKPFSGYIPFIQNCTQEPLKAYGETLNAYLIERVAKLKELENSCSSQSCNMASSSSSSSSSDFIYSCQSSQRRGNKRVRNEESQIDDNQCVDDEASIKQAQASNQESSKRQRRGNPRR